jgi:hypothetical protein
MTEPEKPVRQVLLELPPKGGLHCKAPRDSLSAMALVDSDLFVGSDEGVVLDRISALGPDRYGQARQFPLLDLLDLPNRTGEDDEIDIEGLDLGDDCVWLVGSHTWTRGKPKEDPPRDLELIQANANRHVLARLPLLASGSAGREIPEASGKPAAARLPIGKRQGALPKSLRRDPHIGLFRKLPSKENGLDIEGIAVRDDQVFLGLRGPVLRGIAIVLEVMLHLRKPDRLELATLGEDGARSRKHFLDLSGNGVRDLHRDGDDLLILSGPTADLDGRCSIWRWREPWAEAANSFTAPGARLKRLLRIPVGNDDDHPEAFVILPGGNGRELMVGYDAPASSRKVGKGSVLADVFPLRD